MIQLRIENLNHYNLNKGEINMKQTVFRYELMVKDMAGGGINPEHSH